MLVHSSNIKRSCPEKRTQSLNGVLTCDQLPRRMRERGGIAVTHTEREILSQPELWEKVLAQSREVAGWLRDRTGAGLVPVGAGSTYYVGLMAAAYLESRGVALARAVPASEYAARPGELAILISRSGTTTEVLEALEAAKGAGCLPVALTGEIGRASCRERGERAVDG